MYAYDNQFICTQVYSCPFHENQKGPMQVIHKRQFSVSCADIITEIDPQDFKIPAQGTYKTIPSLLCRHYNPHLSLYCIQSS